VKKFEQINPYLERASKDVSAYFYHSIFGFRLINNKNQMTKTYVNIFRNAFYGSQCTPLDSNNFSIIFNNFFQKFNIVFFRKISLIKY